MDPAQLCLWFALLLGLLTLASEIPIFIYKLIEKFITNDEGNPAKKMENSSNAQQRSTGKKGSKGKGRKGKKAQQKKTAPKEDDLALLEKPGETPAFLRTLSLVSRILLHLTTLLLTAAFLLLVIYFLTSNMDIRYVLQNSREDHIWYYKLVGIWSGEKGSLLLWLWLTGVTISVEDLLRGKRVLGKSAVNQEPGKDPQAGAKEEEDKKKFSWKESFRTPDPAHYAISKIIMLLFLAGFTLLVIQIDPFEASPDNLLPELSEGVGLNYGLQTPMMVFHPPVVFLAYAMVLVPFASSISYLLTKNKKTLETSYIWARLAWLFFTAGLVFGAIWAYTGLGWGRYWGWDPVEVGNLVPWLFVTLFLHAMVYFQRKDQYQNLLPLFGILTFATTLLATFITRSGFWTSLHSYAVSSEGLGDKFIRILEESTSSRFFLKVLILSLILGEMLYSLKLFNARIPLFKKKLDNMGLVPLLRKRFLREHASWEKAEISRGCLELLGFGLASLKTYLSAYFAALRGVVREKGISEVFPANFTILLGMLFLIASLHIVIFMELAFISSNIAGNIRIGLTLVIMLLLFLPLSWYIMMEEEGEATEFQFPPEPSMDNYMKAGILALCAMTITVVALLMSSIDASNPELYESRLNILTPVMLGIIFLVTGKGLLKDSYLAWSLLGLLAISGLLFITMGEMLWLYLPLTITTGLMCMVRLLDFGKLKEKDQGTLGIGLVFYLSGISGLLLWSMTGGFNTIELVVLVYASSLFCIVKGRHFLDATPFKKKDKGKRLIPNPSKSRKKLFAMGSHIIHLGLIFIILGYALSQDYEASEHFDDVSSDGYWNFEGYGFRVEEIEVENGSSRWYTDAVEKMVINIDIFQHEISANNNNSDHYKVYASLEIVLRWITQWDVPENESMEPAFRGAFKQEIKVVRPQFKDFYLKCKGFTLEGHLIPEGEENAGDPVFYELGNSSYTLFRTQDFNLSSISLELKIIPGINLLWGGGAVMMAGIFFRTVYREETPQRLRKKMKERRNGDAKPTGESEPRTG